MMKEQEIEKLTALAAELGPESYVGPWLESVIPEIKQSIISDVNPTVSWTQMGDMARKAEERLENLNKAAAASRDNTREANKMIHDADIAREKVKDLLRELEATIKFERDRI